MAAKTNSNAYGNIFGLKVAVRKMWVVFACMLHRQLSHITVSHLGHAVTQSLHSLRWGEVRWGEVRWGEVRWVKFRWSEARWGAFRWGNFRWGEARWGEVWVRWEHAKWGELLWGNAKY